VQRDEEHELADGQCPACGCDLTPDERIHNRPVCARCDQRLDAELAAYLAFVQVCRD
jgi:hypothetical protein